MPVTYYVAMPFVPSEDGCAPGEAKECQSEPQAIRLAESMSRKPEHVGALAFKRTEEPSEGCFADAIILKRFGDVPENLDEL